MKVLGPLLAIVVAHGAVSACSSSPSDIPAIETPTPAARTPRDHARDRLRRALVEAGSTARVDLLLADDAGARELLAGAGVALDERPESFAVVVADGVTKVIGRDETGAMYGALELAERLADDGWIALPPLAPFTGAPATAIRGANLLLSLPEPGDSEWWFLDHSFWEEYLDLLARARMNFLDLQGMYDLRTTLFPNLLPHFAWSQSHPDVGAPLTDRLQNVRMLNDIIAMAAERGIRVGVMSYRADTRLTGTEHDTLTGDELATFEREAAADLAARAPGLWKLGFRIGESEENADFYRHSFVEGVQSVAPELGMYIRTWLVDKADTLALSAATRGHFLIEVKYNGEQLGPPHLIAGGLMGQRYHWADYSYEDFLSPPTPYDFLFQVWSGGTTRLFRHASFEQVRRTVTGVQLGVSAGFTLLATHAFLPQRDFYHRSVDDRFSTWSFARDELEYLLFGRLAYDPTTDEQVFRAALRARTGAEELWPPVQAASEIVPWIQTAHTCGPDTRHFAPDLEWGGDVRFWAQPPEAAMDSTVCRRSGYHGPFDLFAVASPHETASDLLTGRPTTRLSSLEVAREVLGSAARAREAASVAIDDSNPWARDVARECVALADLGEYFGHKLRGATALAVFEATGRGDYLSAAMAETEIADTAWAQLGVDTQYIAPFWEMLRMAQLGLPRYHWSYQGVGDDPRSIARSIDGAPTPSPEWDSLPPADTWLNRGRTAGPGLVALFAGPPSSGPAGSLQVTACLARPAPEAAEVSFLWKPFSGSADWQSVAADPLSTPPEPDGPCAGACRSERCSFGATLTALADGAYFALEIAATTDAGWRYPDVLRGPPYITVAPPSP